MRINEIAAANRVCLGGCGLSATRHRTGTIDPFGTVHFADRRFTRRAAKNLLLLIAQRDREEDPGFLNVELYDWFYLWRDSTTAVRLAANLGFRLPSRLFDGERELCRMLASRRGVKLSKYKRVYQWSRE